MDLPAADDIEGSCAMKPVLFKTVSVIFPSHRRPRFDVEVKVWRDSETLRAYRNSIIHSPKSSAWAFVSQPFGKFRIDDNGKLRRTPYLCEVNFSLEQGTPLIITHEAFHIVMMMARRMRLNPACARTKADRRMEECFAIAHENITSDLSGVVQDAALKFLKDRGQ